MFKGFQGLPSPFWKENKPPGEIHSCLHPRILYTINFVSYLKLFETHNLELFRWSEQDFKNTPHVGQPDLWQFDPVEVTWN